jgi:hypothetical protein
MLKSSLIFLTSFFLWISLTEEGFAGTHFSIQGSANYNNLGLNNEDSRSACASIAQDLGKYFRIGVTYRQGTTILKGYKLNPDNQAYGFYEQRINSVANSLDFILILYYGETFVPYVQLGAVKKDYLVKNIGPVEADNTTQIYSLPIVPSAGIGLGIKMSTNFSLKLSYTVSPGIKQTQPDQPPVSVLDSYSAVGVSYDI